MIHEPVHIEPHVVHCMHGWGRHFYMGRVAICAGLARTCQFYDTRRGEKASEARSLWVCTDYGHRLRVTDYGSQWVIYSGCCLD